ncbi:MAG: phosphorothioated DNA-binding restriction endonuclease [Gammaproteobacteria bacterium]
MDAPGSARWRAAVSSLNTWKRGSTRAPHKPLLTLLLLARAEAGLDAEVAFDDVRERLKRLLMTYGPQRSSYHPENPFWHLQSDGFWLVRDAARIRRKRDGRSVSSAALLEAQATGYVPQDLWAAVRSNVALVWELSQIILDQFWPETLHESIRNAVGLSTVPPIAPVTARVARDPRFRDEVLRAYERRCAVCGYDGRLNDMPLGLEAAHVRWHAYQGPDTVSNALALCSYHHVALDKGALGLDANGTVRVSADVSGNDVTDWMLCRFAGQRLRRPQSAYPVPAPDFVAWHSREVFRGPARAAQVDVLSAAEGKGVYDPS